MNNSVNQHFFSEDAKDDPIVSDSQLPIALECSFQRFSILLWRCPQSDLNGTGDTLAKVLIDLGDIFRADRGMVE